MYQRKIRLEATWTFRGMASTGTHFGNGNRGVQAETIRDSHFYFQTHESSLPEPDVAQGQLTSSCESLIFDTNVAQNA